MTSSSKPVSSKPRVMEKNKQQESSARCIVLFDIDGTLLAGPKVGPSAGMAAMNRAVEEMTGVAGVYNTVEFAGRTDVQIARDLLIAAGETDLAPERVMELVALYVRLLENNVKNTPYTVIGNPRGAVEALKRMGAIVGLGTGNVRSGARVKLESSGIGRLFETQRGGFGEDGDTRAQVLLSGARSFDPTGSIPVVIVGDTPHDVSAAHEIGAKCVGTPYRRNDAKTLRSAGADAIVELIDTPLVEVVEQLL